MIELEAAIAALRGAARLQQKTTTLPIIQAVGQVVPADISSPVNVPPFPRAAMDGYAIIAADSKGADQKSPVTLKVIGEWWPGDGGELEVYPGTALRIMTGAVIPPGYDAVIQQEDTDYGETVVELYREVASYENYCHVGEDFHQGDLVIPAHTRLTHNHIGLLASMGFAEVEVLAAYRVGIISTGGELSKPGEPLPPNHIYASSGYTIASYLNSAGLELAFILTCPDDPAAFTRLVEDNLDKFDLLITTGAVSVGTSDFMAEALARLGTTPLFDAVAIKPGTPAKASLYDGRIILSLSGNPFAAYVNFQLFFWPIMAVVMGNESFSWQYKEALVTTGAMPPSHVRRLVRARYEDGEVAIYTNKHKNSMTADLPESNCLIDQPLGLGTKVGDWVRIILWN